MSRLIAILGAVLLCIVTAVSVVASSPAPAGQIITNRATATFFNTRLGLLERVRSNAVEVQVLPVAAMVVTGGQALRTVRGGTGVYTFVIENAGNVPIDAVPTLVPAGNDDFDTVGLLVVDSDRDGLAGSGDREIDAATPLILAPGERVTVLYTFTAPRSVREGDVARATLQVSAEGTNGALLDGDAAASVTIVSTALSLDKVAEHREEADEIDYTLRVRNNAEGAILPYSSIGSEALLLDGAPITAVLVRDVIPLNTHFFSGESSGGFRIAYHRYGDPEHSYISTPTDPVRDIDAVAFLHEGIYDVGRASDLTFTVSVVDTVDTVDIENTASGFVDGVGGILEFPSNRVSTPVSGPGHRITFRNEDDTSDLETTPFFTNLRVRIGAARCNATSEPDAVAVTLRTIYAGDIETVIAYETGPNTGTFLTAPLAIVRVESATQRNDIVEGAPGDSAGAIATAVCLGETLEAVLQVQPGGFVFDSVTNAPVAGARVQAFGAAVASAVQDALLPSRQSVTMAQNAGESVVLVPASAAVAVPLDVLVSDSVTDADGYYDLGAIEPGAYEIEVSPPQQYEHPSVRESFDGFARRVDPVVSYGVPFRFDGGPISGIDIPLDPDVDAPVALFKSADRRQTRRGGVVLYTLDARNNMAQALLNTRIVDTAPRGFTYVDGSARLEGEPLDPAPVLGEDGSITFDAGLIGPQTAVELTYALRAGPAARQGRALNTAVLSGSQAGTGKTYASSVAQAVVRVDDGGGVFTDETVVIGRVFLDRDGDGVQRDEEGEEPGVPGVKIVTASGLSVVTDEFGRYSLFGLPARTTVFALATETLPVGARPLANDIDDAEAPGSRFIDLKRGDVRTEVFALEWTEAAAAEVARRKKSGRRLDPTQSRLRDDLPLTFDRSTGLSSRSETARLTTTEAKQGKAADAAATGKPAPAQGSATPAFVETDDITLADLDPTTDFIDLSDGMEVGSRTIRVRIKSPSGSLPGLKVNGEAIPDSAIGVKKIDTTAGVQLHEYVAVRLNAGSNALSVAISDPFGNVRGERSITISAPGDPAGLRIVAPSIVPADPAARIPVVVRVVDEAGRAVSAPVEVTLYAERGDWDVDDIRDGQPGIQVLVDRGEATFDFVPPNLVGTETIRASSGLGIAEARLSVTPDLGNRIFVGVVEGAVAFDEKGVRAIETLSNDEISFFEETTEGVRGQLYLKGKIRGDALLTLRYDSDQDTGDRLFRDIRRDEFYPVYGDNSERGFDAQSSSQLYVKVERGTSYILYGDIAVEARSDAVRLGGYRRSLTGGRVHVERGPVTVDLFVAETDQEQRIVEVNGRGVSGPYDIDFGGIVDGSEIVELLVRDRDQPDVILSAQSQERLNDYVLDFFAGTLIFNRPVPRLDDNLNPVSIRVTYESEEGAGDDYLVYGGEARVQINDMFAVGYRDVRSMADRASDERRSVQSAYGEADLGGWGKASVELSATRDNLDEDGYGARADYAYTDDRTSVRIEGAVTDEAFDAPSSTVSPGREELRALAEHRLDELTTLGGEALYSRDRISGERRVGGEATVSRAVTPTVEVTLGGRAVRTDRNDETVDVYSAIAGVAWRPTIISGLALRGEYEQDFVETDNRRVLLGADYQVTPTTRIYAVNEISTSETGRFGLGDDGDLDFTTKVGAEYRINDQVSGFSEFRDSPTSGEGGGVAQGIKAVWSPTVRLSLRSGFEHVEPIANSDSRETSASFGAAWNDEEAGLVLRGDVEVDRDDDGYGVFTNASVAYAYDDDLTLLARNRFAIDDRGEGRLRDRLRLGAAWRPAADSRYQVLGLYEFEIDEDDVLEEQSHRWSIATGQRVHPRLRTTAKYAGEHYRVDGAGIDDSGTLHLLRGGIEFDLVPNRFAIGGNAMAFTDDEGETLVTGAGLELKAHVMKNVQLGVGYNHVDVDQERLRDLYHAGLYMRLRVKLDSDMWGVFDDFGLTGE